MSVTTQVLENGQWVTRRQDVWSLINRDRVQQSESEHVHRAAMSSETPEAAILTKTVVRSPVVESIIPARIRHHSKNDVLFIGQDYIRIDEAHANCVLNLVAVKDDFGATIKAAKAFGVDNNGLLDAIIKEEGAEPRQDEELATQEASSRNDGELGMGIEEPEPPSITTEPLNEDGRDRGPASTHRFPPQMLALVLDSSKLVFLYAASGANNSVSLVTPYLEIPQYPSRTEQLGCHLAIDPRSRALAVSAQVRHLEIFAIKPRHQLEEEFRQNSCVMPIQSVRSFEVNGVILKMDFLYPGKDEDDDIVLVLVVARGRRTKLLWYRWNAKTPLRSAQISPDSLYVEPEGRQPLLMIPLTIPQSLLLVCEYCIVGYKDLLAAQPGVHVAHTLPDPEPEEPAMSKKLPILTQWARPVRARRDNCDRIYLCREDGVVQFFEVLPDLRAFCYVNHHAGNLGLKVDTAFAVIDLGQVADDFLIAGGDCGPGGHWMFSARHDIEPLASRPNWSPVIDSLLLPPVAATQASDTSGEALTLSDQQAVSGTSRLFACTSRTKHGGVTELRSGLRTTEALQAVDLGMPQGSILRIWAFQFPQDVIAVLVSHVTGSLLLRTHPQLDPEQIDMAGHGDSKTVAAIVTSDASIIQVTENQIMEVTIGSDGAMSFDWSHEFSQVGDCTVIAADFAHVSSGLFAIFALQHGDKYSLAGGMVQTVSGYTERFQQALESRPVCLATQDVLPDKVLLAVGLANGSLRLYLLIIEGSYYKITRDWSFQIGQDLSVCDSISIIAVSSNPSDVANYIILCGLRNGEAKTLRFNNALELTVQQRLAVGKTSVLLSKAIQGSRKVLLQCDEALHQLKIDGATPPDAFATTRLISTAPDLDFSTAQDKLTAFAELQALEGPATLAAVHGSFLRFLALDESLGQAAMRPFPLDLTPVRCLYSAYLQRLVVLSIDIRIVQNPDQSSSRSGIRALDPIISFIDVSENAVDKPREVLQEPASNFETDRFPMDHLPGERFLGVCEWFPQCEGNTYHFLCVNTIVQYRSGSSKGRLILYKLEKTQQPDGRTSKRLVARKLEDMPNPVYSCTPYTGLGNALLYCCGKDLVLATLDQSRSTSTSSGASARWHSISRIHMRSSARHIFVHAPYIYVSGASSLQVFYCDDVTRKLSSFCGDTVARHGVHHLLVPGTGTVLATDLAGSITALKQPESRQASHKMVTLSEVSLFHSIIRLAPAQFPIARSDRFLPGGPIVSLQSQDASNDNGRPSISDYRCSAVIGTSTDGTLTQLHLLSDLAIFRLLKFIQSLCERNSEICPFTAPSRFTLQGFRMMLDRHSTPRRLDPRTDNPRFMHVDGDVLLRLINRSSTASNSTDAAQELLLEMLSYPTRGRHSYERVEMRSVLVHASPSEDDEGAYRWQVFLGLAGAVLGESSMEECGFHGEASSNKDEASSSHTYAPSSEARQTNREGKGASGFALASERRVVGEVCRFTRYVLRDAI